MNFEISIRNIYRFRVYVHRGAEARAKRYRRFFQKYLFLVSPDFWWWEEIAETPYFHNLRLNHDWNPSSLKTSLRRMHF